MQVADLAVGQLVHERSAFIDPALVLQVGAVLSDPAIAAIAARHDRTAAQIVLRWHVQHGTVAIPKSQSPVRMRENLDLFGFELDDDEMARIDALDRGEPGRLGGHPERFG